jgi:hypothetical protein
VTNESSGGGGGGGGSSYANTAPGSGISQTGFATGVQSGNGQVTISWGPAADIALSLSPSSIAADGTATSIATATVTDANGDPVWGEPVSFSSTDPGEKLGPVTDHGDGTYTATIASSKLQQSATITATDSSVSPSMSARATLTQTSVSMAVSLSPSSIVANGSSTSTAMAKVTDGIGNGVSGDGVSFSSTDPGETLGPVVDHGDGTYTATITSSKVAGRVTITATDSSVSPIVSGRLTLIQAPGPATSVTVGLSPSSIIANGTSQSTVTTKVTDVNGNPVSRDNLKLSSGDSGEAIGPVTPHGNGIYTAKLTSSTVAHQVTITATDSSTHVSGHAKLTQTPGRAKSVTVGVSPSSILANGSSHSTATATVTDANGNRVSGNSVRFSSSDPGVRIGVVTLHSNGTYTAALKGSTTAHLVTITATDTSVSPSVYGHATLTQTAL